MAGVKKANSNLLYVYHMDKTSLSDTENLFLNGDSLNALLKRTAVPDRV